MRHFDTATRLIAAILLLAVAAALLGVWVFGWKLPEAMIAFRDGGGLWSALAAVGALLTAALAAARLLMPLLLRMRRRRVVSHRFGEDSVSVSIDAVEQIAARCVREHRELCRPRVTVREGGEGVTVDVDCTLRSGTDLPVSADYLQRQIRRHIADATGFRVQAVNVRVEGLTGAHPAVADVPSHEPPPAEAPAADDNKDAGGKQA